MNKYNVLVIDDDIWMQRIISKVLEGFGFVCYTASNGFDGVALALEHQPMVIFLDIMMPELSGHLTLKMLKRLSSTNNTPVVMISALSDTENLGLAVKIGAVGFVSKPFTRATIYDKMRSIIGSEMLEYISKRSQMDQEDLEDEEPPNLYAESAGQETPQFETEASSTPENVDAKSESALSAEASKRYKEESNQKQIEAVRELLLKDKAKTGSDKQP